MKTAKDKSAKLRAFAKSLDHILVDAIDFDGERLVTDSLCIADAYGMSHKKVLRSIEKLNRGTSADLEAFFARQFERVECVHVQGKRKYCYRVSEMGFLSLCLGGTSDKAQIFRLCYLSAFARCKT